MKTFVKARHPGTGANGKDGCHTRWASPEGFCSGVKTAEWLNGLGEDEDRYTSTHTIGMVRQNWLRGNDHIMRDDQQMLLAKVCPYCNGTGKLMVEAV
jgi:hypothetical protein